MFEACSVNNIFDDIDRKSIPRFAKVFVKFNSHSYGFTSIISYVSCILSGYINAITQVVKVYGIERVSISVSDASRYSPNETDMDYIALLLYVKSGITSYIYIRILQITLSSSHIVWIIIAIYHRHAVKSGLTSM